MQVSTPRVAPCVPCWEFRVKPPDMWMQYPADAAASLEEAYQAGQPTCKVCIHQYEYSIFFPDMDQTNLVTGKIRPIRRTESTDEHAAHPQPEVLQSHAEECSAMRDQIKALEEMNGQLIQQLDASRKSLAQERKLRKHNLQLLIQMGRQAIARRPDCSTATPAVSHRELRPDGCTDEVKRSAIYAVLMRSMASHRKEIKSLEWCPPPEVVVTRFVEVKNPVRQGLYEAGLHEVLQRNPNGCSPIPDITALSCHCAQFGSMDLNEFLLFHGCPLHTCEQIASRGFDPQRGGEVVGAMFGRGTYFAQNASKSDFYTTCSECSGDAAHGDCSHPHGERCLVLARVLLGQSLPVTTEKLKGITRAPERQDGEPYDSITALTREHGGRVDHMEFVIFKEQMALPQYLIYYRHAEDCWCHNCWRRWPKH
ncbi:Tnks [Symbiodinium sp. CCMP2456]|nr:Tnks [Symbiodinium sp. CCMP2456]